MIATSGAALTVSSIAVAASIILVAALAVRDGSKSIIVFVAGYFLLFAFGPVLNFLLGNEIYFGITLETIPASSIGMCLALVGMFAGSEVIKQRHQFDRLRLDNSDDRVFPGATVLNCALAVYATGILALHGAAMMGGSKLSKVAAAGPHHYSYLTVAMLASATYFTASRTRLGTATYWTHLSTYTAYCLMTDERDFIFVYFTLLLHVRLFRKKTKVFLPLLAGGGLLALATFLFAERSDGSAGATQALNQGSILFVDSYVERRYPGTFPFVHGATYLDAILGLFPTWMTGSHQTLSEGLVQSYASGSNSGYGFSLTAEAYMNFGMAGIVITFLLVTMIHRFLVDRVDTSFFYAYASMSFTIAWMYAIRGESASFLKFCLDGLLLYSAISLTSWRPGQTSPLSAPPARPVSTRSLLAMASNDRHGRF